MISCTEFIPSYSELFTFLEERYGRDEVERFWKYLFEPDGKGIPLVKFVLEEGIQGCFSYWKGTLNEEAADFTMYLNVEGGWFFNRMHYCPSKGRLLELKESTGVEPYHDYCLHCDNYRQAVAKAGLEYIYNFIGTDEAACSMLIYDPKVFNGKVVPDEHTIIMDRRASDNEYFHKDFHSSLNMGLDYLGKNYGEEAIHAYLAKFTNEVYGRLIEEIRITGLDAIEEKIRDTYAKEHAEDVLTITRNKDRMDVFVSECPAVKHLHATDRAVTPYYRYSTIDVMQILAEAAGKHFVMDSYEDATGKAHYHFE